jgi:hypothetical protein
MVYCKEVCDVVCRLIAEGFCLRQIEKAKGLPAKSTIMRWLNDPRKIYFLDAYRRAKELQRWFESDKLMDLVQSGYPFSCLGRESFRVSNMLLRQHDHPRSQHKAMFEAIYREQARRLEAGEKTIEI